MIERKKLNQTSAKCSREQEQKHETLPDPDTTYTFNIVTYTDLLLKVHGFHAGEAE